VRTPDASRQCQKLGVAACAAAASAASLILTACHACVPVSAAACMHAAPYGLGCTPAAAVVLPRCDTRRHACRLLYSLAFGTLLEMGIVVITLLHLVSSVKQPGQEHDVSGEVAMTAASLVLTLVTFALSMWGSGSAIVGARALVRRVADATSRRGSAISDAASRIQTTMGDVGPRRTSIADAAVAATAAAASAAAAAAVAAQAHATGVALAGRNPCCVSALWPPLGRWWSESGVLRVGECVCGVWEALQLVSANQVRTNQL
jgi:hypothetical protein